MADTPQKTVLVTDDDAVLRGVTVKLIEARGHHVLTADSGEQAIEVFASGTPIDLHVLDVVMQGIDGFETMRRLSDAGFADVPVVFLTAKSSDEDILDGYRAGAGYYVTKPFKPAALLNIVDFLIGDLSPSERDKLALRL
jgi:two-component system chemotaxis response regulator CheY